MKKKSFIFFFPIFLIFSCSNKTKITPYDLALLSADVYEQKNNRQIPDYLDTFLEHNDNVNDIHIDLDLGKIKNLEDSKDVGKILLETVGATLAHGGYFGRAYVNQKNNQLIIAHRGTDIDKDYFKKENLSLKNAMSSVLNAFKDLDDDFAIFNGDIPKQQFEAAEKFTQVAIEKYASIYNKQPKVIHTGHSLGAVLAELCAAKNNCKAITFESPGTKPLIEKLFENDVVNWKKLDITSYNAEPNQINSIHEPAGKIIPLYDSDKTSISSAKTFDFDILELHSIENILHRFDPKSGLPK